MYKLDYYILMEENRYFLLYSLQDNKNFRNINILDSKLKRVYCGSPIESDSISLKIYSVSIEGDTKIPISKRDFLRIKKESSIELRKTFYVDFFKKYNLEEWIV